MTAKDRKLLQMILVIFVSFIVCYMPITVNIHHMFGFFFCFLEGKYRVHYMDDC